MKNEKKIKDIASERVHILLNLAYDIFDGKGIIKDELFARKYVKYAYTIKKHYKLRMKTPTFKICKHCYTVLIPGKTAKVKIASSKRCIIYTCLNCNSYIKVYY